MAKDRRLGDRRRRPRFEIVGELWGTLDIVTPLPLRNVGRGGALLESRRTLPVDSVHPVMMTSDSGGAGAQVRVRHVNPVPGPAGEEYYLIGLEFLALPASVAAQVDRWTAMLPAGPPDAEAREHKGPEFRERRRAQRVTLPAGHQLGISIKGQVRIIDISLSGVCLASDTPAPVGSRAQLRLTLDGLPFAADVEIKRSDASRSGLAQKHALGAAFLPLEEISQRMLEQLLTRASS